MPQGDWHCPRCTERAVVPGIAQPGGLHWRTPGAHDYISLAHMLGARLSLQTVRHRGRLHRAGATHVEDFTMRARQWDLLRCPNDSCTACCCCYAAVRLSVFVQAALSATS